MSLKSEIDSLISDYAVMPTEVKLDMVEQIIKVFKKHIKETQVEYVFPRYTDDKRFSNENYTKDCISATLFKYKQNLMKGLGCKHDYKPNSDVITTQLYGEQSKQVWWSETCTKCGEEIQVTRYEKNK